MMMMIVMMMGGREGEKREGKKGKGQGAEGKGKGKTGKGKRRNGTDNRKEKREGMVRYDTIRLTILTCAQKLRSSQLNLPHGMEQKPNGVPIDIFVPVGTAFPLTAFVF